MRSASAAQWQGRAHIGTGWAAFLGTAGDNHPHAHHAVQLLVAFGEPVTLWTSASGPQTVKYAVVPRDLTHALQPSATEVGLLYIDAESALGRSLNEPGERIRCPMITNVSLVRSAFEQLVRGHPGGLDALLAQFAVETSKRLDDVRVRGVLERLQAFDYLNVTVTDVAAWVHLSPSRFAHRFRRHTGMPLRPYIRWLRLQRAAAAMIAGATATTAAHAAGFADGAHLSRTFRRHFGVTPAMLTGLGNR